MCELLGFSSRRKQNIDGYLHTFYSHCVNNPSGWGLAAFDGQDSRLYTEPVSADDSPLLPQILEKGIEAPTVLAHLRKATVGGIKPANCHPFVQKDSQGMQWTLMHNGTIFSGLELLPYQEKQVGDTDSERILLYLVDRINGEIGRKGCELNAFERFKVVEQMIDKLSYRNKLNLIIYDGEQMYVHVNMEGTLFYKSDESSTLFATVPLDEQGWEPLPLTTLFVYQNGKLQYRGKNHHNEYIDVIGASVQQYDYNI